MKVVFTKLAKQELEDAIQYYEMEHPGLGTRFKQEVKRAAQDFRISWSVVH
jgi:hypothetical protein